MSGNTKVEVHQVSKFFSMDTAPEGGVHALDQVSFSVHDGEILALTGLSGCGKTTLLRIIMGLEAPESGSVEVDGRVVRGCGFDRGMVFQHAALLPWRSALANVEFGLETKGIPPAERRRIARDKLELVGLADSSKRLPTQLSGGMQQRVGLARALAIDPEVLLMDEPFGALDAITRQLLQRELLDIHEKTAKTILFVTHDLDEAVLLADRVLLMAPTPGRVWELIDIDIPRGPRRDTVHIRGTDEFTERRHHLWKSLMASSPMYEERSKEGRHVELDTERL